MVMATLQGGNREARTVTPEHAQTAVEAYLREYHARFEYIRIGDDGEVQIKAPGGHKVIIRYSKEREGAEVILC